MVRVPNRGSRVDKRERLDFEQAPDHGPPIVWLASDEAAGVHDERIVAAEFDRWLLDRQSRKAGRAG